MANKQVQKTPDNMTDAGTQATTWDIFDVQEADTGADQPKDEEEEHEPLVQIRCERASARVRASSVFALKSAWYCSAEWMAARKLGRQRWLLDLASEAVPHVRFSYN